MATTSNTEGIVWGWLGAMAWLVVDARNCFVLESWFVV